jgi:hypothetical protein
MIETSVHPDSAIQNSEAQTAQSETRQWVKPQVTRLELETAQATA